MVLMCSAGGGSWILECDWSSAVTSATECCCCVCPQHLPVCHICLQKQCDSGGMKAAMECSLLGTSGLFFLPSPTPSSALELELPAQQLNLLKAWKQLEFWLPALLSHMVLLRMAVPAPFHTEVKTFSLLNAVSCSPSSSNVNSFELQRLLAAGYCAAEVFVCSGDAFRYCC